jgi:hypothetical protein
VDHPLCVVTGDPHRVAGGPVSKPHGRLTFQPAGDAESASGPAFRPLRTGELA